MTVTINGDPRDLQPGTTVAQLLDQVDDVPAGRRGVAVAVDAEVVPRAEWETTEVADGARVEILVAIQGG
jgi:sulfur carrier protein